MRTCAIEGCGKRFDPVTATQLYCSKKHTTLAAVRRLRAKRRGDPPPEPPKPGPGRVVEVVQSERGVTLKAGSSKPDRVELRVGDVLKIGDSECPITGTRTMHIGAAA